MSLVSNAALEDAAEKPSTTKANQTDVKVRAPAIVVEPASDLAARFDLGERGTFAKLLRSRPDIRVTDYGVGHAFIVPTTSPTSRGAEPAAAVMKRAAGSSRASS